MERMRRLAESDSSSELTHEELVQHFEEVETQSAECKYTCTQIQCLCVFKYSVWSMISLYYDSKFCLI